MNDTIQKKALISVADKTGIVAFARALHEHKFEIIATGGTQKLLEDNGIVAVKIGDYTGGAESERVKTLSQRVAKEILETGEIGLVVCNLYPFFDQKNRSCDEMIEFIDIGGVTLIRAAAKNYKKVGVAYDPRQYDEIAKVIGNGTFDEKVRLRLAQKAFDYIAWYDVVIANYFSPGTIDRQYFSAAAQRFLAMRYGENPHQAAAFFLDGLSQEGFKIHGGKQISYNNILDAEVAFGVASEYTDTCACAVIKHQTPCGIAIAKTQVAAFTEAYQADAQSAFGGIVGLNRSVDTSTAGEIVKHFFEVVIAPGYDAAALDILKTKKNLRVVEIDPALMRPLVYRPVFGGMLVQERDRGDAQKWEVVTERSPNAAENDALKFAWRAVKWTKSNSVVFVFGNRTVGIGAGQTSRVGAVEIAARQASECGSGMVMASDAFFPFRDGVDAAARAGVTAVVQPGGSKRDQEVIDACNEHGMAMVFTGTRHFRH
jgi:phosphoribosylaminoimidazolecarboxamide formyltransferase/IMP cyclohydrolase